MDENEFSMNQQLSVKVKWRKWFLLEEDFILGPVEVHITKEKEPIDGSPLIVHAFDPTAVSLLDIPDKLLMNTTNRFVIDPIKAGKGSLKIAIRGMPLDFIMKIILDSSRRR